MAVKPDNITTFYSPNHGYVKLVKRSIGYYKETLVQKASMYSREPTTVFTVTYWRGQLVNNWTVNDNGETWDFSKGDVVWLRATDFHRVDENDYLQHTDI